jgi:hypothetical protein
VASRLLWRWLHRKISEAFEIWFRRREGFAAFVALNGITKLAGCTTQFGRRD